jgi:hypothetical protein
MPKVCSTFFFSLCAVLGATSAVAAPTTTPAPSTSVAAAPALPAVARDARLALAAPNANPVALKLAVSAMQCAQANGQGVEAKRLTLIDYSKPSLEPRLYVFDLENDQLLFEEHVAHGRNSGNNETTSFSNQDSSYQTSLGLFLTGETYEGSNGYSMRLEGLDPGLNDKAMSRAIVMHGSWYVDPVQGAKQGRLGRSLGCPALRNAVAKPVIDTIKHGNFVFSYSDRMDLVAQAKSLECERTQLAKAAGAGAVSAGVAAAP